jgi:hypothetical protein
MRIADVLDKTVASVLGTGSTSVSLQLLMPKLHELNQAELVSLLEALQASGHLRWLFTLTRFREMREFIVTNEAFYEFAVKHKSFDALDAIEFFGGIAAGVIQMGAEFLEFLFNAAKFVAEEQQNLDRLIRLLITGKKPEATKLFLDRYQFYASVARRLWKAVTELVVGLLTQPIELLKEKLVTEYTKFQNHMKVFEYFEAGKVCAPLIVAVIGAAWALYRAGSAIASRLAPLLPRITVAELARRFSDEITRRMIKFVADIARGATAAVESLTIEVNRLFGFSPRDRLCFEVVGPLNTPRAVFQFDLAGLLQRGRNLLSKAVRVGDDTLLDDINDLDELFYGVASRQRAVQRFPRLEAPSDIVLRDGQIPDEIFERAGPRVRGKYPEDVFRLIWTLEDLFPGLERYRLRPLDFTRRNESWSIFQKYLGNRGYTLGGEWPGHGRPRRLELDNIDKDGFIDEFKTSSIRIDDPASWEPDWLREVVPLRTDPPRITADLLEELELGVEIPKRLHGHFLQTLDRALIQLDNQLAIVEEIGTLKGVRPVFNNELMAEVVQRALERHYGAEFVRQRFTIRIFQ